MPGDGALPAGDGARGPEPGTGLAGAARAICQASASGVPSGGLLAEPGLALPEAGLALPEAGAWPPSTGPGTPGREGSAEASVAAGGENSGGTGGKGPGRIVSSPTPLPAPSVAASAAAAASVIAASLVIVPSLGKSCRAAGGTGGSGSVSTKSGKKGTSASRVGGLDWDFSV